MNLKKVIPVALMLLYAAGSRAQDWSSPEVESMLRTYVKQVFQVNGKVYGVDDYD